MDLKQLAAIVAVAETGTFSRAARRLHTVQSNVSTHVARLERELGATLVNRATGTLTPEGEIVVERARRVQHELESLRTDVEAMLHDVAGPVRLGCLGTVSRWLVPQLFNRIGERHPLVNVIVVDATTTSLVPQLITETLDLAVINLPVDDVELTTEVLFDEDRVLIVPRDHPLAAHEHVDLELLAEHPILLEPQGTPFRDELDQHAEDAGLTMRAQAEVDGIRLLTSLAFEGYGAALVPATAAPPWLEISCRRIAIDGLAPRSVGLAYPRRGRLSATARAVRMSIRDLVAEADQTGVHKTIQE